VLQSLYFSDKGTTTKSATFAAAHFTTILSSHFPALFCTLTAYITALLAMFVFMLTTFIGAGITHISAYAAYIFSLIAAETHKLSGSITYGSTFHIELNTFCHHFYVFFLCTGGGAMVTGSSTLQAGVNTTFILMISGHKNSFNSE